MESTKIEPLPRPFCLRRMLGWRMQLQLHFSSCACIPQCRLSCATTTDVGSRHRHLEELNPPALYVLGVLFQRSLSSMSLDDDNPNVSWVGGKGTFTVYIVGACSLAAAYLLRQIVPRCWQFRRQVMLSDSSCGTFA